MSKDPEKQDEAPDWAKQIMADLALLKVKLQIGPEHDEREAEFLRLCAIPVSELVSR